MNQKKCDSSIRHVFSNPFFSYQGPESKTGEAVFLMGDGSSYEGHFVQGEISGKGVRRFPNGNTYSGDFIEGEFHGNGEWLSHTERYIGQFVNNQRHGEGELITQSGLVIRGNFHQQKLNGKCQVTLNSAQREKYHLKEFTAHFVQNSLNVEETLQVSGEDGTEEIFEHLESSPYSPFIQSIVRSEMTSENK